MNIPRLKAIILEIETNPQHWDQSTWHCGTQHCLAGLSQLAMMNLPSATDSEELSEMYCSVEIDAMLYLELNQSQADYLFSTHRTLADFKQVALDGEVPRCFEPVYAEFTYP